MKYVENSEIRSIRGVLRETEKDLQTALDGRPNEKNEILVPVSSVIDAAGILPRLEDLVVDQERIIRNLYDMINIMNELSNLS